MASKRSKRTTKPVYQDSFRVGRALFHLTIRPDDKETNFYVTRARKRVMAGRLYRNGTIGNVHTYGAPVVVIEAILKHVAAHASEV